MTFLIAYGLAVIWASSMWVAIWLWFARPLENRSSIVAENSTVSSLLVEVGDAIMTREEVDALCEVRDRWHNKPVEAH